MCPRQQDSQERHPSEEAASAAWKHLYLQTPPSLAWLRKPHYSQFSTKWWWRGVICWKKGIHYGEIGLEKDQYHCCLIVQPRGTCVALPSLFSFRPSEVHVVIRTGLPSTAGVRMSRGVWDKTYPWTNLSFPVPTVLSSDTVLVSCLNSGVSCRIECQLFFLLTGRLLAKFKIAVIVVPTS